MNTPTPRTDAEIDDRDNGPKHMADDHMCCRATVLNTIEFIQQLKRERDSITQSAKDMAANFRAADVKRIEAERERDQLKERLEIESAGEICSQCGGKWNPSLVESGWCIFCIQKETARERDTAKELLSHFITHYEALDYSKATLNAAAAAQEALNLIEAAIDDERNLTPDEAHAVVRYASDLRCHAFELQRTMALAKVPGVEIV